MARKHTGYQNMLFKNVSIGHKFWQCMFHSVIKNNFQANSPFEIDRVIFSSRTFSVKLILISFINMATKETEQPFKIIFGNVLGESNKN